MSYVNSLLFSIYFCVKNQNAKRLLTINTLLLMHVLATVAGSTSDNLREDKIKGSVGADTCRPPQLFTDTPILVA